MSSNILKIVLLSVIVATSCSNSAVEPKEIELDTEKTSTTTAEINSEAKQENAESKRLEILTIDTSSYSDPGRANTVEIAWSSPIENPREVKYNLTYTSGDQEETKEVARIFSKAEINAAGEEPYFLELFTSSSTKAHISNLAPGTQHTLTINATYTDEETDEEILSITTIDFKTP